MGNLTNHFNAWEFDCSCGCDKMSMNPHFLAQLEDARVASRTSYTITSGYRCASHPESVKRPTSSHTKGLAVDIHTPTSRKRALVMAGLMAAKFNRIGIGANFIHVDGDPDKESHVFWTYYE
jgi:zinc D-Ala-D-Ala carboxypeptidase